MPTTGGEELPSIKNLIMTQREGREEILHWRSGSVGPSSGMTSNLGVRSKYPAWCLTMTMTTVSLLRLLTVLAGFSMYHKHSIRHLPDPVCLSQPLWFPLHQTQHILPPKQLACHISVVHNLSRTCHVYNDTIQFPHTASTVGLPACTVAQTCHTYHTYCVCSVARLHRNYPRWLCSPKACVCQEI